MSEHYDKVKEIIVDKLGVEVSKITLEAQFINDLGADSLNIVEIVMEIEDEYGIEIPDEDVEELNTVGDLKNYIKDNT